MFGTNVPGGGVPLVGQARQRLVCLKGHVDELPGPVVVPVPDERGQVLMHPVCRVCLLEFVKMIEAKPAPPPVADSLPSLDEVFRGR